MFGDILTKTFNVFNITQSLVGIKNFEDNNMWKN